MARPTAGELSIASNHAAPNSRPSSSVPPHLKASCVSVPRVRKNTQCGMSLCGTLLRNQLRSTRRSCSLADLHELWVHLVERDQRRKRLEDPVGYATAVAKVDGQIVEAAAEAHFLLVGRLTRLVRRRCRARCRTESPASSLRRTGCALGLQDSACQRICRSRVGSMKSSLKASRRPSTQHRMQAARSPRLSITA